MTQNASLSAMLGYRDAHTAIDWLRTTLGAETTALVPDDDGGVAHSEHRAGDVVVVVFTDREGYERPARKGDTCGIGLYITLADDAAVDAAHARAVAAGGDSVWEPHTSEWGNHRSRVVDPGGVEWTFGTYRPGDAVDWA